MDSKSSQLLSLDAKAEKWPLKSPFRITGHVWDALEVVRVSVRTPDHVGHGEAAGVYYKGDTPAVILQQLQSINTHIDKLNRRTMQALLPPGGARNALDCALWDLESKETGQPVWQLAGLAAPKPLMTTFTCGADHPENMANVACAYTNARAIKLKLTGEAVDADRVRAVREARGDVWLGVDANQGFTRDFLEWLMPTLVDTRVQLIEQPFRIGSESLLSGFDSPIPLAADESVQVLADISPVSVYFDVVNIKLDKCGGLTEGLEMARAAQELGLQVMVGNMLGTSLAMAPAFVLGQLCQVVDLDGPVFLKTDRSTSVDYTNGFISCPNGLWGGV